MQECQTTTDSVKTNWLSAAVSKLYVISIIVCSPLDLSDPGKTTILNIPESF